MTKRIKQLGYALAVVIAFASAQLQAEVVELRQNGIDNTLIVPLFHSVAVNLDQPAARVSVGNPDIADILILRASQLYVIGKDLGTTNVLLWDKSDNLIGKFDVQIAHDLDDLKQKLYELMPDEPVEVYSTQRNIVLRGTVSSVGTMQAALDIADGYLAQIGTSVDSTEFDQEGGSRRPDKAVGQIINLLQVGGGQQVMLEVKVAEISRRELKRLNAQFNAIGVGDNQWVFGGVNGGATFPDATIGGTGLRSPIFDRSPIGPALDEFAPADMVIGNQGLFASYLSSTLMFNLAIDAARENGLAKILAEPTLTTLTGESANFLSGGEFPVPVPGGVNGNTIEYKKFGVQLEFLPVVLGSGKINFKLNVEVSEPILDSQGFVTDSGILPRSLISRGASVTLELHDGQTMGIAGLINENLREVVTKFPGLGDLPVLGALFRSQEFQNDETELVILVTPRLAKPAGPEGLKLPTDNFIEPTDLEFYLLGRTEGRAKTASN